jgi:hypothetical protein
MIRFRERRGIQPWSRACPHRVTSLAQRSLILSPRIGPTRRVALVQAIVGHKTGGFARSDRYLKTWRK